MIIGVTMGDASGVGPEILLKAHCDNKINQAVVVFGDLEILQKCSEILGYDPPLRCIDSPTDYRQGFLNICDQGILHSNDLEIGRLNAKSGAAAREYVVAATKAALAGDIAAITTLPMNKAATKLTDPDFTGHTEMIASLCGAANITMMLATEKLIVTHISGHLPLAEAVKRVKKERILSVIQTTHDSLCKFIDSPRIGVAGLNPHSGEGGAFGEEEVTEIAPAIEAAKAQGLNVSGPIPPDTVFFLAACQRRFDAVVCMYHDQGHIPIKLLDFEGGVNITLGLPIVRTSVDHGTAFDIAYKGMASTRSFTNALDFAVKLLGK